MVVRQPPSSPPPLSFVSRVGDHTLESIFTHADPFDPPGTPPRGLDAFRARTYGRGPATTPQPRRSWGKGLGEHYWYGCGKIKSKIQRLSNEITNTRGRIAAVDPSAVPEHPEVFIAENMPESLPKVGEDAAHWHGCAKCRWELSAYERILAQSQRVLQGMRDAERQASPMLYRHHKRVQEIETTW